MRTLITGGAGFIGCNLTARLIRDGHEVIVFDNLSRPGTPRNIEWLRTWGEFALIRDDITDAGALDRVFRDHSIDVVLHLAGQVAVTSSVTDPRDDFNINALGTFNVMRKNIWTGFKNFIY
mgnify:CR=1 FL=1